MVSLNFGSEAASPLPSIGSSSCAKPESLASIKTPAALMLRMHARCSYLPIRRQVAGGLNFWQAQHQAADSPFSQPSYLRIKFVTLMRGMDEVRDNHLGTHCWCDFVGEFDPVYHTRCHQTGMTLLHV